MADTSISWTKRPGTRGKTWNPTSGCSLLSEGCRNCYAMRQARRFAGKGKPFDGLVNLDTGKWTGKTRFNAHKLTEPLTWREPCTIFVDSMSDLFHDGFSYEEIAAVFGIAAACPQHTFLILTKRAERMLAWSAWMAANEATRMKYARLKSNPGFSEWDHRALDCWHHAVELGGISEHSVWNSEIYERAHLIPWPLPNVWLGTSVENQDAAAARLPSLAQTPARVRFISAEPLLGSVDLVDYFADAACRQGGGWVIVGAESGPGARPCNVSWIRALRDQCVAADVPFFFKQAVVGDGVGVGATGYEKGHGHGGNLFEMPALDGVQHLAFPEVS